MPLTEVATMVAQVGLPVALVIYFVWRGDKREVAMSQRLADLEKSQTQLLKGLVSESTRAFIENTACLRRNSVVLEKLVEKTQKCPGPHVSSSELKLKEAHS